MSQVRTMRERKRPSTRSRIREPAKRRNQIRAKLGVYFYSSFHLEGHCLVVYYFYTLVCKKLKTFFALLPVLSFVPNSFLRAHSHLFTDFFTAAAYTCNNVRRVPVYLHSANILHCLFFGKIIRISIKNILLY